LLSLSFPAESYLPVQVVAIRSFRASQKRRPTERNDADKRNDPLKQIFRGSGTVRTTFFYQASLIPYFRVSCCFPKS